VFALSSFVPTQRFGALMFTLLTAALVGNLLLLPAVLCSPLAYFFGRRLVKQAQAEGRNQPPVDSHPHINEAIGSQIRHDTSHRVRSS